MNEFKKELSVDNKKEDMPKDIKQKISDAVWQAIDGIEANNEEEQMIKLEYMMNIRKIMNSYEELKPVLTEYFENKRKEKGSIGR